MDKTIQADCTFRLPGEKPDAGKTNEVDCGAVYPPEQVTPEPKAAATARDKPRQ